MVNSLSNYHSYPYFIQKLDQQTHTTYQPYTYHANSKTLQKINQINTNKHTTNQTLIMLMVEGLISLKPLSTSL